MARREVELLGFVIEPVLRRLREDAHEEREIQAREFELQALHAAERKLHPVDGRNVENPFDGGIHRRHGAASRIGRLLGTLLLRFLGPRFLSLLAFKLGINRRLFGRGRDLALVEKPPQRRIGLDGAVELSIRRLSRAFRRLSNEIRLHARFRPRKRVRGLHGAKLPAGFPGAFFLALGSPENQRDQNDGNNNDGYQDLKRLHDVSPREEKKHAARFGRAALGRSFYRSEAYSRGEKLFLILMRSLANLAHAACASQGLLPGTSVPEPISQPAFFLAAASAFAISTASFTSTLTMRLTPGSFIVTPISEEACSIVKR